MQDFGADPDNLNVYASYRGNWEVILRGLFTNKPVQNLLATDILPGSTLIADNEILTLPNAANFHRKQNN